MLAGEDGESGLGWHLHRVWSVDWFRNPNEAIDAVVQSVQRAMALGEPGAGVPVPLEDLVEAAATEVTRAASPAPATAARKRFVCVTVHMVMNPP